ncbi:MAG: YdbL family protein [Alphaproteobacteria bacterium]|nr:YdbL family protein [Alphaproteobacteria bacterium SS10]
MLNRVFSRRAAFTAIAAGLMAATAVSGPALAQQLSLDVARSQGLVGELPNGLIGAIVNDPAVIQLVQKINVDRLAAYQNISRVEQTPLSQVQAIAGRKIYENVPRGTFVQAQDGSWVKK